MKKIIGIVGAGIVGRDPFDPKCWSRSGYNLFMKLKSQNMLARAFGVEVPHPLRGLLMIKNFHPERRLWAQRLNLDPVYYRALTREIRKKLLPEDFEPGKVMLQIGGHYNSSAASRGKIPAYSYHDGNIGGMMKSPFFPAVNLPHAKRAYGYEKGVFRDMTKIFVMAEYWRHSFIEDFGVEPKRVVNIGFGVNIEIPPVAPKDYSKKNVIFIGIDFSRKGGENLVAAFQKVVTKHPDAKLHIIGPHEPPAALKQPGLKGIEFHGYLSREVPEQKKKVLEILNAGTLLVLPSLYEPFGNAGLEGMLFRMPVIATRDWSFPDFVDDSTGRLLDKPGNIDQMAEFIDFFLSDPARTERMGNAGREMVMSRYTWDKVVEALQREVSSS